MRSCDQCKHGWVTHDQVEVVHSGVVCDLSALILFGTQAFPVRMKILLDRLFSVLTHQHVLNILHTHGWTLHDYIRGYKLQDCSGKVLDHWVMMTPEEELVTLRQFVRFGETKSSAEMMISQQLQLPSNTFRFRPTKHEDLLNTTQHGTSHGVEIKLTRGQRSPGLSYVESNSGGMEECSEASSLLHHNKNNNSQLQQNLETQCRHNREPGAEMVISPLRAEGDKTVGARDRRPCSSSAQKFRVSCGSCGKTFYDKGTLKIHYNAVHLKIKHRCTVEGCDMTFSSLRSRNRHSANPNPRLHNACHTHSTHNTRSAHCMTSYWASSRSPTSPVKSTQEVIKPSTPMLAPATASSVNAFANMNSDTEIIDQHKMMDNGAGSAGGVAASTYLWTNQNECKRVSGVTARKKSRKSTMPVKIKRETRDEDT